MVYLWTRPPETGTVLECLFIFNRSPLLVEGLKVDEAASATNTRRLASFRFECHAVFRFSA